MIKSSTSAGVIDHRFEIKIKSEESLNILSQPVAR